jgi:1-acyl-sn-glycerol-3-phosphate acyltransferase
VVAVTHRAHSAPAGQRAAISSLQARPVRNGGDRVRGAPDRTEDPERVGLRFTRIPGYILHMRALGIFHYLVAVVATLVLAPPAFVFGMLGWRRAAYVPVRCWAWVAVTVTGVRCRGHGLDLLPTEGPYVVVANHCSHLDSPCLVRALPHALYFVVKRELTRIPLFGPTLVKLGFVIVDRSNSEEARRRMAEAVELIREGRRVLVFAEGTRSTDGHLQSFKKGGFRLAIEAQVPVVPVAINGSHRLLPKGELTTRPGTVDIVVCEPIPTTGMDDVQVDALAERARRAILEARRLDPDFPSISP